MIEYKKVTGNFDLKGKAAIVVGGGGGIGGSTAEMYALANHASNTITVFTIDYEKNIIVMNGKPIKVLEPNSIRIWPVPEN